jgi:hypothetical protein
MEYRPANSIRRGTEGIFFAFPEERTNVGIRTPLPYGFDHGDAPPIRFDI